ncbi:MAG: hypothetical protein ACOY3P_20370 [Planctomycetota bacterium]
MPLPQIVNPRPLQITASYDSLMMVALDMSTTSDSRLAVNVRFRPYDYTNGVLYPSTDRDILVSVHDAWTEAVRSPLFAQVMGGIVQVGNLLVQERDLLRRIGAEADTTAKQTLIDQLHALRDSVGIAERYVAPEPTPEVTPDPIPEPPQG